MPPLRSLTLKDLHAAGTGIMDKVVNADKRARDKLKAAKKARERASGAHPPTSNQNENRAPRSDNAPHSAAVHRPSTAPPRRSWCLKELRASPFGTHNLMDDVVRTKQQALEARNAARKCARKRAMQLKRLAGDPPSQSEDSHDGSCYRKNHITKTDTEGPIPRVIGKWTSTDGQVVTKMLQEKDDGSKFRVMRMVEGPGEGENIDAELTRQAAIRRAPVRAAPGEGRQRPVAGPADSVAMAAATATHPAQPVPVQEVVETAPVQDIVDAAFVQDIVDTAFVSVLPVQGADDATAVLPVQDVNNATPVQGIVDTAFVQDAVLPVQGVDDAAPVQGAVLAAQDVDNATPVQNAVLSIQDAVLLMQGVLPVQLPFQQFQQITHLLHVLENARADLAFKEFIREDLF